MTREYSARLPGPFADLGVRTARGAVVAIDYLPRSGLEIAPADALAEATLRAIEAYLDDPLYRFELPLAPGGTPFESRVWSALQAIPAGDTLTYGALARRLASAARAVGGACGRNPIPLVIPCHRVVAADGSLGGFMGGRQEGPLAIKRWLLEHEGALSRPRPD